MKHWRNDMLSGFIVFLIAMPLSLGIAMASGVPPLAGLIAAIVGGLLVSRINGSYVTINGPAAGLIVVVLHGLETLGNGDLKAGYGPMLAAIVISGILLFIAGRLKVGNLADAFPASAVHGMLAAIGIIIFAKQIHIALGVVPTAKTPLALLSEVPHSFMNMNPEIACIGFVCLSVLVLLPLFKHPIVQRIPAPMVVVIIGLILSQIFSLDTQHHYLLAHHMFDIGPNYLVNLPAKIWQGLRSPDFSSVTQQGFISVVITLTLVQGLETLLSAAAVDRFDPEKRVANLNKDLSAVGIGSAVSGMLGGLPIIAEIVRSRANVSNGAKTSWANFFHGLFMLIFVVVMPGLIHQIPLACLAAILIVTGYRLASPLQFKNTLHIGVDQLLVFVFTLVMTLGTDLLIGVCTGILLELFIHIIRGAPLATLFKQDISIEKSHKNTTIYLRKGILFTNFLGIKRHLVLIPQQENVVVDVSQADFIDHTVMEKLYHFIHEYKEKGGSAEIRGLESLRATTAHPFSTRKNA